eukprot:2308433-Prymnesium_polylepis.1
MSAPAPQLIAVDATFADAAPAAKSATLELLEIIGATVARSAAAASRRPWLQPGGGCRRLSRAPSTRPFAPAPTVAWSAPFAA